MNAPPSRDAEPLHDTQIADRPGITIRSRRFVGGLAVAALVLIIASITGQWLRFAAGYPGRYSLIEKVFLGAKMSIPTYFSALLLLMSAGLLFIIASEKRHQPGAYARRWSVLAFVFFLLSVDEVAGLHGLISPFVRALGGTAPDSPGSLDLLHFGWVVPGLLLVVGFGLYLAPLLWHLPSPYRLLFVASGALFVGGAAGMEVLGTHYAEVHGTHNFLYTMYPTVEETIEMSGLLLFLYALLSYAREYAPTSTIRVRP